jgi:hypothetical protein
MKFYLCQTAEGPRYARTQADAKALDKDFKLVEYDTDQASLVERFNELLAMHPRGAPPVITIPDDLDLSEEIEAPVAKPKKVLERKPDRLWDQIELEEHIFAIGPDDISKLDAIERTVAARRDEIAQGIMV